MEREVVHSSIIQSIGYDEELQVLQIEFKKGNVRDYQNISKELYQQMMQAESKGKFYLKYVRGKFKYDQ